MSIRKPPKIKKSKNDVFGWWGYVAKKPKDDTCSMCGAPGCVVPASGHPNSKYWALQRTPDEELRMCSDGCLENDPRKKQKIVMQSQLITGNTWLKNRICAWMDPTGKLYSCGAWFPLAHSGFCDAVGLDEKSIEKTGWVKISGDELLTATEHLTKEVRDKCLLYVSAHKLKTPIFLMD